MLLSPYLHLPHTDNALPLLRKQLETSPKADLFVRLLHCPDLYPEIYIIILYQNNVKITVSITKLKKRKGYRSLMYHKSKNLQVRLNYLPAHMTHHCLRRHSDFHLCRKKHYLSIWSETGHFLEKKYLVNFQCLISKESSKLGSSVRNYCRYLQYKYVLQSFMHSNRYIIFTGTWSTTGRSCSLFGVWPITWVLTCTDNKWFRHHQVYRFVCNFSIFCRKYINISVKLQMENNTR